MQLDTSLSGDQSLIAINLLLLFLLKIVSLALGYLVVRLGYRLITAGAKVSVANREGVTPLQLAAMNGNAAMLLMLIKAGADPNAPLTEFGDTALMMASRTGKTDAISVLLETGAQVNAKETWAVRLP